MGDNCDPNNCSRCDRYAERIAAFKQDIQKAPHFDENDVMQSASYSDLQAAGLSSTQDISSLAQGIYLMKVKTTTHQTTLKLVKQ